MAIVIYHAIYSTFIFWYAADHWWFGSSLQGLWDLCSTYVVGWGRTLAELAWIAVPLDYVEAFGNKMYSSGKFHPSNEGFTVFFFLMCWPALWYWSSFGALWRLVEIPWILLFYWTDFYLLGGALFVDQERTLELGERSIASQGYATFLAEQS